MASILFIQKLFASQDRVVKYNPDAPPGFRARCPVCEFCNFEAMPVYVENTSGEIRHCTCSHCLSTFRACGPTTAEIKAEAQLTPEPPKKSKGRPPKRKRNR